MNDCILLERREVRQDSALQEARDAIALRFVESGSGILRCGTGETALRKGDVFWLPPGKAAQLLQPGGLRILELVFPSDALLHEAAAWARELQSFLKPEAPVLMRLPMAAWAESEALLAQMDRELRENAPGSQAVLTGLMLCLAGGLLRVHAEGPAPSSPPQALEKVLRYMEEHFSEEISLAEISALAGVSPRHFDRMFAAAFGVTPKAYLARLRIARARALLLHTDRPVTEIAFDCGYADSNYFARVFRRLSGQSPQQFRCR